MNLRWVKIVAAILVVGFIVWFGSHLRFTETKVPLPLKGEAISNPYYAAIKLAGQLHAKAAWERIFTMPATDSVVLLSNWNWSLSHARRERIEAWVADGGRLVVDDSLIGGAEEFEKWAGVSHVDLDGHPHDDDADAPPADDAGDSGDEDDTGSAGDSGDEEEPTEVEATPHSGDADDAAKQRRPPRRPNTRERNLVAQFIQQDCTTLTEDGSNRKLDVCGIDPSTSLASSRKTEWALRDGRHVEALRVKLGRGSVTVLNAVPFRYRDFLQGDHPTLFVAATQLHHGDRVFFFTEEDHASLLALTWRHAAPVVLLLGALIVLALWRNVVRFGPLTATPDKARRSLAEQIRGTGQFTLRFGGGRALHAAMVRAVREAAIKRLPGYDRMPAEERVAAIAKLTGIPADDLGPALNHSGTRSPHELRNVIAVLETARRRLSVSKKKA